MPLALDLPSGSLGASRSGLDVVATVTEVDRPLTNVMVWVDGRFMLDSFGYELDPPYGGNSWSQDGNNVVATVDADVYTPEPGDADVLVSLWEHADNNATYLQTTVHIGGPGGDAESATYIEPSVSSGQAVFGNFPRTLFNCPPSVVTADGIASTLASAGVSHLTLGIFTSPADAVGIDTYADWLARWEALIKPGLDWCAANGFRIIGQGDDFFRTADERDWLHTSDFAEDAVRHVAAYLATLGICDGIEMVDEVGSDPDAYDPTDFIAWWRDEGGPPLAWPNQGPYLWEVPELSDYSSRYSTSQEWRPGRPKLGKTTWQLQQEAIRRGYNAPTARPLMHTISCCGEFYTKYAHGGDYREGYDLLQAGATRSSADSANANDVVVQAWLSIAYGASGLRLYAYDWALWREQRAGAAIGTESLQTGSRPGDTRWDGVVIALLSIANRESSLLDTPYVPTTSGPWVFGKRGGLVFGINTTERTLPSPNGSGTIITASGETTGTDVPGGGVIVWE